MMVTFAYDHRYISKPCWLWWCSVVVIFGTQYTDCFRYFHWISKRKQDMSWKKGYDPLVCINYDCKTTSHGVPENVRTLWVLQSIFICYTRLWIIVFSPNNVLSSLIYPIKRYEAIFNFEFQILAPTTSTQLTKFGYGAMEMGQAI